MNSINFPTTIKLQVCGDLISRRLAEGRPLYGRHKGLALSARLEHVRGATFYCPFPTLNPPSAARRSKLSEAFPVLHLKFAVQYETNNIRNITHLPRLPQLFSLDLGVNDMEAVSWECLRGFPRMEYLFLRRNRLQYIDLGSVIDHLPKLKVVDIRYNKFTSLSQYQLGWPQMTPPRVNSAHHLNQEHLENENNHIESITATDEDGLNPDDQAVPENSLHYAESTQSCQMQATTLPPRLSASSEFYSANSGISREGLNHDENSSMYEHSQGTVTSSNLYMHTSTGNSASSTTYVPL
uniref:Uncharacterized protein n=1 Tax=Branchiostoma floridae TaxID=7739 RepID=C3YYF3_BRAFL|eukprot:XP_002598581.1 hypothetical protein BRAFLDRAFT_66972 [Branchiostoma floridae]